MAAESIEEQRRRQYGTDGSCPDHTACNCAMIGVAAIAAAVWADPDEEDLTDYRPYLWGHDQPEKESPFKQPRNRVPVFNGQHMFVG